MLPRGLAPPQNQKFPSTLSVTPGLNGSGFMSSAIELLPNLESSNPSTLLAVLLPE